MPLASVSPFKHACDVLDLDYSDVAGGLIKCTVCPRQWQRGFRGHWMNSCAVQMPGATRTDWWEHNELEEIEPPTEEEVLANRQMRLDMLDQKAREHAQYLQDTSWGFDWLQRERGSGGKVDHEWYAEMMAGARKAPRRPQHRLRMIIRFPSYEAALSFLRIMRQWP